MSKGIIRFFGNRDCEYDNVISRNGLYVEGKRVPVVNMVFPEQVHSDGVVCADSIISYCLELSAPLYIPQCDAVVISRRGHFAAIVTADCVPILVSDSRSGVVAAIHSGREGTRKNITGKTLDLIFAQYGSKPQDIEISLGPAISAENYPVSEDIFEQFVSDTGIEQTFPNLDLKKVIKKQIIKKGCKEIEDIDICTYNNEQYFSYRRDKTTQRQLSLIGII